MEKKMFEVRQTDPKGLILSRLYVETTNAVAALLTFAASPYRIADDKTLRLSVRTCK